MIPIANRNHMLSLLIECNNQNYSFSVMNATSTKDENDPKKSVPEIPRNVMSLCKDISRSAIILNVIKHIRNHEDECVRITCRFICNILTNRL